ncbi:hypothetical protein [Ottowia sp.]|uniref:hypothetical protein n=1 Tax=Ottowia sp. TaxID=1898956 RepID=UPI0025D2B86A|nr:hypothetical protein [Ottowia sp.]MBK6616379.1 hypothetical protein [Ottowia sp.]
MDEIVFATRPCRGEQEGVLGFAAAESGLSADDLFDHPHLSLPAFGKHREIVGAWDGAGFGFRFRGDKLTRKMSEFGASLKGGNGVFAASFLRGSGGSRLSGVVIGLVTLMRPEDRAAVGKEQSDFAATVRLEGRARTQEIAALAEKAFAGTGRSFGYVWPVWRGGVVDSEVAYCVNPGFGTTLRGGPYEFEQLATWLRGGAVGLI